MGGSTSRFVCHVAPMVVEDITEFCADPPQTAAIAVLAIAAFVLTTLYFGFTPEHFGDKTSFVRSVTAVTRYRIAGVKGGTGGTPTPKLVTDSKYSWTELCFKLLGVTLSAGVFLIWFVDAYPAWLRIVIFSLWGFGLFLLYLFGRQYYVAKNYTVGLVLYGLSWLSYVTIIVLWSISIAINRKNFALCEGDATCAMREMMLFGTAIAGDVLVFLYILGSFFIFISLAFYGRSKRGTNGKYN